MKTITSVNPATDKTLETYDLYGEDKVRRLIETAEKSYLAWKKSSFEDRSKLMYKAAEILEAHKEKYARMMTAEMGKTFTSAQAEVEKCAWVCRYYAENAASFLKSESVKTDASISKICYRPLGVILAVMPWNYPMWQVFRFAAPALMAGNVGVLKHASNVPGSALLIQEVFKDAGFPKGTFTTLLISSDQVEKVIEHSAIKAVTLTGSGPAGASVASIAGRNIKKSVLELGGSDPYLILKDADLEWAAEQCKTSRLLNTGQSCIGAKRFIVVKEVYDDFLELFKEKMALASIGDPMSDVDLGPMARKDLRDEVHDQVQRSIDKGAKLILGGEIPNKPGAFYPATILTNVKAGMPAYDEEIFGPVASVIKVNDESDAIRIANDSVYGLGACVFTKDLKRGEKIAEEELNAGSCFVNQFVKSDPRLPFGGIKSSGYGRELSYLGIREFVNIKTVYVK